MIRIILLGCFFLSSFSALAQQGRIPDFGNGKAITLDQEYYLGRAWLTSFRRQVPILNDAQVQDYVEALVYRLAVSSNLRDRRLEIVVVRNQDINAFTVPGGIVGINSGLLLEAKTEAQFASVLSHELAHLSQRHFVRGLKPKNKSFAVGMADLLNVQVMISAESPADGAPGQAATRGSQLRYSRLFEEEADLVGIQNLAGARLNPGGMAGMLEVLQGDPSMQDAGSYEFLRSHPVTDSRIAEARSHAGTYPKKIYEGSREFQLMRARVELNFFEDSGDAVAYFRAKQKKRGNNAVANQYGLVIALTKNGDFDEARKLLRPMREFAPNNMVYALAEANIDIESEHFDAAIAALEKWLQLAPNNHPTTMYLSKAYYFAGRYADAAEVLGKHSRVKPDDAYLWYLLALDREEAGDKMGAHQARAEYLRLNGAVQEGIEELSQAIRLSKDRITRERIKTRLSHFQMVQAALLEL